MKNRFLKVWKTIVRMPMFWVFVLLMAMYMPKAILMPAENDVVVVCTGVGIDKADEGIELSILTLIPQNSLTFADSYRLVSAKAQNIALATNQLVNYLGKRVDLAHASYVVLEMKFVRMESRQSLKILCVQMILEQMLLL